MGLDTQGVAAGPRTARAAFSVSFCFLLACHTICSPEAVTQSGVIPKAVALSFLGVGNPLSMPLACGCRTAGVRGPEVAVPVSRTSHCPYGPSALVKSCGHFRRSPCG